LPQESILIRHRTFGSLVDYQKAKKLLKADTLKQLRPIGKGDQELEKRLDQKELT
jgi:hypothetical protein